VVAGLAESLVAALGPPLTELGFGPPEELDDGVRFQRDDTQFEARYVPRDGELAVRVIRSDTGDRFDLLLYLRAVKSSPVIALGDAVAESVNDAVRIAHEYAKAIPDAAGLLIGDPVEVERARGLRWWNVGADTAGDPKAGDTPAR
jgi:hypothetical protein